MRLDDQTVYSFLTGLGNTVGSNLKEANRQRMLSELGGAIQSGDMAGATRAAFSMGDLGSGIGLMKLKAEQDKMALQREADAQAMGLLNPVAATAITPPAMPQSDGAGLPRGLRNMNPGNIEAGRFAQSQPGFVGSDGRFAKFDTLEHGVGAHAALLGRYADKGINTVAGVVNRWAPQAENGAATGKYAQFVANKLGVAPNSPIDLSNPETRTRLAYAMGEFENGRPIATSAGARPVQVADSSGGVPIGPQPAQDGGTNIEALKLRLQKVGEILASPRQLSSETRQKLQGIQNQTQWLINNAQAQANREEDRAYRRQQDEFNRQMREDSMAMRKQAAEENALKATGEQANAATFSTRMAEADKIISDPAVFNSALGFGGVAKQAASKVPVVGNMLVGSSQGGDQYQKYEQAQRDFVNAVLRKESGAAINASEFDNARKQYFPQPGDTQAVIEQKAANRRTAIDTIAQGGSASFRKEFSEKRARGNKPKEDIGIGEERDYGQGRKVKRVE